MASRSLLQKLASGKELVRTDCAAESDFLGDGERAECVW